MFAVSNSAHTQTPIPLGSHNPTFPEKPSIFRFGAASARVPTTQRRGVEVVSPPPPARFVSGLGTMAALFRDHSTAR